ncbi:MAG TPA: hypothetical protein VGX24_07580 [Pyrinomonadaceae bacterium]|jgi:hypothetical protein|nr:hypothetical protein [Pyrinomonadaceae bacterium]
MKKGIQHSGFGEHGEAQRKAILKLEISDLKFEISDLKLTGA